MATNKIGLAMFWIGAVLVFVTGWLVMWWVFPIWKNSPVEQFEGTVFAFEGPLYMTTVSYTHLTLPTIYSV